MRPHRKRFVELLREHLPPGHMRGAEIGVQRGRMSEILFREFPQLQLFMVDTWRAADPTSAYAATADASARQPQEHHSRNYVEAVRRTTPYAERRRIIRKPSVEAAGELDTGYLDWLFLDADHSYEGCAADLPAWLRALRPGGFYAGHDYSEKKQVDRGYGVKRAVDEFVAAHGFELHVDQYTIWWLRKPLGVAHGQG